MLKRICFLLFLNFFVSASTTAQSDSLQILLNNMGSSSPEIKAKSIQQIFELAKSQDNQILMDFFKKSLETAAKASISPAQLDEMLYNFSEQAKSKQLEQDFMLMLLKLEKNPDFANPELQLQLQYYLPAISIC